MMVDDANDDADDKVDDDDDDGDNFRFLSKFILALSSLQSSM